MRIGAAAGSTGVRGGCRRGALHLPRSCRSHAAAWLVVAELTARPAGTEAGSREVAASITTLQRPCRASGARRSGPACSPSITFAMPEGDLRRPAAPRRPRTPPADSLAQRHRGHGSTAIAARYMNARCVSWMSTSRSSPNGMKLPTQPGNCSPHAVWAPEHGLRGRVPRPRCRRRGRRRRSCQHQGAGEDRRRRAADAMPATCSTSGLARAPQRDQERRSAASRGRGGRPPGTRGGPPRRSARQAPPGRGRGRRRRPSPRGSPRCWRRWRHAIQTIARMSTATTTVAAIRCENSMTDSEVAGGEDAALAERPAVGAAARGPAAEAGIADADDPADQDQDAGWRRS